MTFEQYQAKIEELSCITTKQIGSSEQLFYQALGLAGETGEVIEHIKKFYREGGTIDHEKIKLEMGDVLWYLTKLGLALNISLDSIAAGNISKIEDRIVNGKK